MPKITVRDVPQLPYRTRHAGLIFETPGNVYNTDNWPAITDEDIARWHTAGFVEVEGLEPAPEPNPDKPVVVTPDKIKIVAGVRSA